MTSCFTATPLLEANAQQRVITSFLGLGIMGLSSTPLPMDRVHLVNPGQSVTVGDRRLTAVKPPVYDNPITTGFVDDRSGIRSEGRLESPNARPRTCGGLHPAA